MGDKPKVVQFQIQPETEEMFYGLWVLLDDGTLWFKSLLGGDWVQEEAPGGAEDD